MTIKKLSQENRINILGVRNNIEAEINGFLIYANRCALALQTYLIRQKLLSK